MPASAFYKYAHSARVLAETVDSGTDQWVVILSNRNPQASDTNRASVVEIPTGGGYVQGGAICPVLSSSSSGGVYSLRLANPAPWTGVGAGFTARYAILWNATKDLVFGYWDYGSSQLTAAGEGLQVTFDAVNGVFTLT